MGVEERRQHWRRGRVPQTSSSHDAEATLHFLACGPRKGRRQSHPSQKVQQAAETGDVQRRDAVRSQGWVPWVSRAREGDESRRPRRAEPEER